LLHRRDSKILEVLRRDRTWDDIQWLRAEIETLNSLYNMIHETPRG
jgi:hypothetical protein